jgi:DNA modification methylase
MNIDEILFGDSAVVLQAMATDSIDLTLTSPPYFNAREYSQYKTYQEYLKVLEDIFTQVFRCTKPSRMVIVNISPIIVPRAKRSEQSYRIPIPYHFVPLMERIGFEFLEDIIWKKPDGSAMNRIGQFSQHLKPISYKPNLVTEYILVFKKPAPFLIDKVLKNEPVTECDIERTNVWEIQPETKSSHPAPFPEELVRRCIAYYSYKGDLVLDPFCGSGTTPYVAKQLNRHYIGIDACQDYVDMSRIRTK